MLIKANHAPLFLVNSYYPCFTLALTDDSARHCDSLEVMGMQPGGAAFRSPHPQVHLEIVWFFLHLLRCWWRMFRCEMFCWLTRIFFFFTAITVCTEWNSRSREQRLLKVPKAEDALNLPFREVLDLLRGKAEWCHFSCFTLAPRGQNVEWCDLGIAELQKTPLRFHWWNMAGARCS